MKIDLSQIPVESSTGYPDEFKTRVAGRRRQRVGDAAGLKNFGVNLTTLEPGSQSALRHWHSDQDEFVYILQGKVVMVTNDGEQTLNPGDMAGFAAGTKNGHHLINRSDAPVVYLEVGDRTTPDQVEYPDDNLFFALTENGQRRFARTDGRAYKRGR